MIRDQARKHFALSIEAKAYKDLYQRILNNR
jgi:hypothetical protein